MAKSDCVRCIHSVVCKYRSRNEQPWIKEHCKLAAREERPHGTWIKKDTYFGTCWATCSVCNEVSSGEGHDNGFGHDYSYPNFCPKCGSDNRPRENNSSSMIINGKYSENVEYGTRVEIRKKGGE